MEWGAIFFIGLGAFFSITGHIGLLSAPDVYTRLQTSSTCSTTAILSILIASMLFTWFSPFTGKIFAIIIFFLLTNPVSTHIIARFAWEEGAVPWRKLR
ncbi:MAG: monovalent cation/H(+) antiporter subunit G [Spirochaetia bacterium]